MESKVTTFHWKAVTKLLRKVMTVILRMICVIEDIVYGGCAIFLFATGSLTYRRRKRITANGGFTLCHNMLEAVRRQLRAELGAKAKVAYASFASTTTSHFDSSNEGRFCSKWQLLDTYDVTRGYLLGEVSWLRCGQPILQ